MRKKLAFLVSLLYLIGNAGFVFSQSDTILPSIINPDKSPVPYCVDSVPVAPRIFIQNTQINESSEGMKISIANYKPGEDLLVYEKLKKFDYRWDNVYGYLEIKGPGSAEEYQEAISKVYYKNKANLPVLGTRDISISLLDADYLPQTGHFYRYINKKGISWTVARDAADTMNYYGLQGYLVTITSAEENDFVWSKINGVGWIGASDAEQEGKWIWATGPEKGIQFWQGNYNGSPVIGEFSFWNDGEPNNMQKSWGDDEDYAHMVVAPNSKPKSWNDLSDEGDKDQPDGYYYPKGFIVEFGGMPGEPNVNLSAVAQIDVKKIAFSEEKDFEICEGEKQQLNLDADPAYVYTWSPEKNISDIHASDPVVQPDETTLYRSIGEFLGCIDTAYFQVKVNAKPVSRLPADSVVCEGSGIVLDPGEHASYVWSTGQTTRTITVSDEGIYRVTLTNEHCTSQSETNVKKSERPVLDTTQFSSLVCGSKSEKLKLSFFGRTVSTILRPLQPDLCSVSESDSPEPTITVSDFGMYDLELEMTDEYLCVFSDTITIGFHNQPKASFDMDEKECQGYNLKLRFTGTTQEEALFTWYYNENVYREEPGVDSLEIPLGFGELNRTVGLKVNEQGCIDSSATPVKVTPDVDVKVNDPDGCSPHSVRLEAVSSEPAKEYTWNLGDGSGSSDPIVQHTFINTSDSIRKYDVTLTVVSTEGCENTGIMKDFITVYNEPTVDFSFLEEDCNQALSEIWYAGSGTDRDTYFWDLGDLNPKEIVQDPGFQKGPLKINRTSAPTLNLGIHVVSEHQCFSDTLTKTWKRKPLFEVKADTTEGCPPLLVSAFACVSDLTDDVGFMIFPGDGTSGTGPSMEHVYTLPASTFNMYFTGTSNLTGCSDTVFLSAPVTTYGVPDAGFDPVPSEVLISDPGIVFQNTSTGATCYEWDFGDECGVSAKKDPVYRYAKMGYYKVALWAYNDLGCVDSISKQVTVAFDRLFPPNAFSPNARQEKDRVFRLHGEGVSEDGYRLMIFNRWGEEIFESHSQDTGWDGKMKNSKFAPAGLYTWILQYVDFTGKKHTQQGFVTLIF